jgi:DNA-binding response OmpR family regulator
VRTRQPDLVILDLMLPGTDGLTVCRALRADARTRTIPVIILSAKAEESDRIHGLDLGADDYVTKPFSPKELVARVAAVERRTRPSDGGDMALTAKEFLLLDYFLRHRGRVLSRERLLTDVWGYQYAGGTRTVDVHVRRLRKKLPQFGSALTTVHQFGYKLLDGAAEPEQSARDHSA